MTELKTMNRDLDASRYRGLLVEYPKGFLGDQKSRSLVETVMETFPPSLDVAL